MTVSAQVRQIEVACARTLKMLVIFGVGEFPQPRRRQLSAAVSRAAAVHESEIGTKLTFRHVRDEACFQG
jgi:hypothetical protein